MAKLEELREFWDSTDLGPYDRCLPGLFPEGFDLLATLKELIHTENQVLEIGCGYGRLCKAFSPEGYIGVDISQKVLDVAKQHNPEYTFELVEIDQKLPLSDTSLLYTVGLHIPNEHLRRFLEPICEASTDILICEIMDSRWSRAGNPQVFNRDPEVYIMQMLSLGFRLKTYLKKEYARYVQHAKGREARISFHLYHRY